MRERARALVVSDAFNTSILVTIVINSIILGVLTAPLPPRLILIFRALDTICVAVYVAEAVLKLFAYGLSYFRDPWNVFDFIIVALCFVPFSLLPLSPQIIRVIRVFRAFKMLRLVSSFRTMRVIVEAIFKAVPGVLSTAVLLFIIFYIYAVIGTVAFASVNPEHFGSLGKSLFSLFQVMTLESWSEAVARPVMQYYPLASLYFITFVIISAFIMINVVVGIVVETIGESRQRLNREIKKEQDQDNSKVFSVEEEIAAMRQHLETLERLMSQEASDGAAS